VNIGVCRLVFAEYWSFCFGNGMSCQQDCWWLGAADDICYRIILVAGMATAVYRGMHNSKGCQGGDVSP
jgi:hypothetical protein